MAHDPNVWHYNSWGGWKRAMKTPGGKKLPKWLRIVLGIGIVLGFALFLFLIAYVGQLSRS